MARIGKGWVEKGIGGAAWERSWTLSIGWRSNGAKSFEESRNGRKVYEDTNASDSPHYDLIASLASIGNVAWIRLDDNDIRITIIPDQGTQVWAVLSIDALFESYTLQSAAENNTINLEAPLQPLLRALKAAQTASQTSTVQSASVRLTKKDDQPSLCVTLVLKTATRTALPPTADGANVIAGHDNAGLPVYARERETKISQDVPVRVLAPQQVSSLHEPRCRDPDVHIILPPLIQLKSISDRFTRLASTTLGAAATASRMRKPPKLELSANMHGSLRLGLVTDGMDIRSEWKGLINPHLDPANLEGGEEGVAQHPSTRMRTMDPADEVAWATVRVDAKDWGRVLGVGRCGGRVVACFCHEHALILYVYLPSDDGSDDSVLTYYVSSYSA